MAGCDYRFCDKCNYKAYYDTDVDYRDCYVVVLCGDCKEEYDIEIKPKPKLIEDE
jgi:transcription elongation factor Elf1